MTAFQFRDGQQVYRDGFSAGWPSVVRDFGIAADSPEAVEPDEMFFADYGYECYEGHAELIYRRGERYFRASGSHCSCYGLEGQWEPIAYETPALLAAVLERDACKEDYIHIIAELRRRATAD